MSKDPIELALSGDGYLSSRITFKCTDGDYDELLNAAHQRCRGNMSALMRTVVQDWLDAQATEENLKDKNLSIEVQVDMINRMEQKRERVRIKLARMHRDQIRHYNAKREEVAKEFAAKYRLSWPPQGKDSELDPELARVLNHTARLWQEEGGKIELRDLQRKLGNYNSDTLKGFLCRLEKEGSVVLDGVRTGRGSLNIIPPDSLVVN